MGRSVGCMMIYAVFVSEPDGCDKRSSFGQECCGHESSLGYGSKVNHV